jgi:hypothetical protein
MVTWMMLEMLNSSGNMMLLVKSSDCYSMGSYLDGQVIINLRQIT